MARVAGPFQGTSIAHWPGPRARSGSRVVRYDGRAASERLRRPDHPRRSSPGGRDLPLSIRPYRSSRSVTSKAGGLNVYRLYGAGAPGSGGEIGPMPGSDAGSVSGRGGPYRSPSGRVVAVVSPGDRFSPWDIWASNDVIERPKASRSTGPLPVGLPMLVTPQSLGAECDVSKGVP
jgi:hypothetical protein